MPRVEVRWGAVVLLPALILVGAVLQLMAVGAGLAPPPTAAYALAFAGTYLAVALVHELGHVAAGWALGLRWKELRIGLGIGVVLTDRSNGEQIAISLAGPAAHLACAVGLIAATGMSPDLTSPLSAAGWMLLAEAVLNLLVPHPALDGGRAAVAAWRCLRGRSAESFVNPRSEDGLIEAVEHEEVPPWH